MSKRGSRGLAAEELNDNVHSITRFKKIGPQLYGIGLLNQILDFLFTFNPINPNLITTELKKYLALLLEKLLRLEPKEI